MEFAWILVALVCGLGVRFFKLPALIGFLLAGFALNFLGYKANETLHALADIGITLMLFTIGLKLNVADLLKREVWLGALSHMGLWLIAISVIFIALASTGVMYFNILDWQSAALLAFALSFSSTVCVVKVLEESGEMKTRHGKVAIGILVMQDVIAVGFLVVATGIVPSIWSVCLLGLYWARPYLDRLLNFAGHGELLTLTGFFLALGSYELFYLVGIKGDLGALIMGMLLSKHAKAVELSKVLMSFKDLFLIGFFISIGFTTLPDINMVMAGLFIALLIPLKFILFFTVLTRLQLRGRTSYLAGLVMGNYSEFGLIVVALCVKLNMLASDWLVILALSVCFSFALTSMVYQYSHRYYNKRKSLICWFERPDRLREDILPQPREADMLVIGMGRVGKGAYDALDAVIGEKVWAMDADRERVKIQRKAGCRIMLGDAEDIDLWENMDLSNIKLILLALPSIGDVTNVYQQLKSANYHGKLAAIARYEDERRKLLHLGVDNVFNFYTEAGTGFAEESLQLMGHYD